MRLPVQAQPIMRTRWTRSPRPAAGIAPSSCGFVKAIECAGGVIAGAAACAVTGGDGCVAALAVLATAGCCDCLEDSTLVNLCNSLPT